MIQAVAREIGVDGASAHIWKERTLAALEEALKPHKGGPKFRHSPLKDTQGEYRGSKRGNKRVKG